MTCIATFFDPTTRSAAMASDGLLTMGGIGSTQHNGPPKIWSIQNNGVPVALIGVSGSFIFDRWWRHFDVCRDHVPARFCELASDFLIDMRTKGHGRQDEGGTFTLDCTVMMVCSVGIWMMGSDGSVWKCGDNYAAIGFGRDQAYGALSAAYTIGSIPLEAVACAVNAANKHAVGCGPLATAQVLLW